MRLISTAVCGSVALVLLAGCSGSASGNASTPNSSVPSAAGLLTVYGNTINVIPKQYMPARIKPMRGKRVPAFPMKGIYVSEISSSSLYGFPKNNSTDADPFCSVPASDVQGFGVDNSGNIILPEGTGGVVVWQGPQMCGNSGPPVTITDPYGTAIDASAINAETGNIAVANVKDTGATPGSISICTLASGTCSTNLTNSNLNLVGGVGMNSAGDCWADGLNTSAVAVLVYFAGCTGAGQLASGFTNGFYGGVDIDNGGNLVTTSLFGPGFSLPSTVNVYSGCNPACTLLSSTLLNGESIYGHIGKQNARYVTTNVELSDVEVYTYTKTGLTLYYSFIGGLTCDTSECAAAAYSPSSKK
ncbi:MAG: hypothetical protein WAK16_02625 [Candidatus Cybelea sp.]|jgi:hypothetical protein